MLRYLALPAPEDSGGGHVVPLPRNVPEPPDVARRAEPLDVRELTKGPEEGAKALAVERVRRHHRLEQPATLGEPVDLYSAVTIASTDQ